MSAPKIPPRHPIGDSFEGVVLEIDNVALLANVSHDEAAGVHTGLMLVRYGVVFLGRPQLSIVPGLLALDYGEFLTGENAWHFLLHRSNLYPRADVVGYRNDGEDDMVVVKALDLVRPLHILVYENEDATTPLAQVEAVIAPDTTLLPQRLRKYATVHPSVEAWRKARA